MIRFDDAPRADEDSGRPSMSDAKIARAILAERTPSKYAEALRALLEPFFPERMR